MQAVQSDDITRRDLARFDQFLDSHREIADQLRKTPSLIDDPQFLQSHPELNAYLQDHPSVKQEISQQPDTFMRLEDPYARDANLRDRDAGGQDRDADPQRRGEIVMPTDRIRSRRPMPRDRGTWRILIDSWIPSRNCRTGSQKSVPVRQSRFRAEPSGSANLSSGTTREFATS